MAWGDRRLDLQGSMPEGVTVLEMLSPSCLLNQGFCGMSILNMSLRGFCVSAPAQGRCQDWGTRSGGGGLMDLGSSLASASWWE
jgi:hypothetical protein